MASREALTLMPCAPCSEKPSQDAHVDVASD